MKRLLVLLASLALAACSSAPKPPEPKGEWYQINSAHYYQDIDKSKGVK